MHLSQLLELPTVLVISAAWGCVPSNFCLRYTPRSSCVPVAFTPVLVGRTQGFQFRAHLNALGPHLYPITSVKTIFLNKIPFTGTRSSNFDIFLSEAPFNPQQKNEETQPIWKENQLMAPWNPGSLRLTETNITYARASCFYSSPTRQRGSASGEHGRSHRRLGVLGCASGARNTIVSKSKVCPHSSAHAVVGSNLICDNITP